MAEALRMIRHELGSEAAVVRSRCVRLGGWMGLLAGKRGVEVTASAGELQSHSWRKPRPLLDQGIDLSGPVSLNVLPACRESEP